MTILPDTLDFSTERLTSFEVPRKRGLLLLRWALFVPLLGLVATSSQDLFHTLLVDLILGILLLVNLTLSLLPVHTFRTAAFEFSMGLFDTALISYVVYQADPSGFLCLFYFILLLSTASSHRIGQILFGSLALSCLYLLVSAMRTNASIFLSIPQLMVVPLFYATSLYFGYQVLQIRNRHATIDKVYRERQELKIVVEILESITSSLDFHTVMYKIAARTAEMVDAVRCSILLLEERVEDRGFVVATSDSPKLKMLPLDLAKYPEVLDSIRRKKPVFIKDVEESNVLRPHVQNLLRLSFRSRLVLPVLYEDAVIGTLLLSASRKQAFTSNDLRLCSVIASAAASAIKNSILYQDLQKQVREKEETAAQIRSLFDNSPDLLLHLDSEGRIQEANRAVETLSGMTRAEILSLDVTSLIRGLPPLPVLMQRAQDSTGSVAYEASLVTAGDRKLDLSVTVGAVGKPKGGLILIGRDVTEQKKATARLQQTEKLSSIGEIVATVAHELNNPLTGVLGFAQLLAQREPDGKPKKELERIVQSADRCQKIVQNLLTFARPSNREKQPLGLNGVLEKTLDLLEPALQANRIAVKREYAANLPCILADFHEIQQVLTNLITNAQQAMGAGKREGALLLRTYSEGSQVVLEVADNGPGIPPEVLPRIFDPFFSTKGRGRGTGLGLSVSYGIVRDHGGDLLVDTGPGKGTTFSAIFPVGTGIRPESQPRKRVAGVEDTGRQVLAVDDEPVIIDLYVDLLRGLGHGVDTASTGLEALKKIKSRDYDLVLTDIKMPKMSGLELYENVVTIKPKMKRRFIFFTGDVNSLTSPHGPSLPDLPCLLKPVNLEKIKATIHALLHGTEPPTDVLLSRH